MLLGLRAAIYSTPDLPRTDVTDVGDGIRTADVLDPWGNVLGIIQNPHFKLPGPEAP